jgi:hypothetical protein
MSTQPPVLAGPFLYSHQYQLCTCTPQAAINSHPGREISMTWYGLQEGSVATSSSQLPIAYRFKVWAKPCPVCKDCVGRTGCLQCHNIGIRLHQYEDKLLCMECWEEQKNISLPVATSGPPASTIPKAV